MSKAMNIIVYENYSYNVKDIIEYLCSILNIKLYTKTEKKGRSVCMKVNNKLSDIFSYFINIVQRTQRCDIMFYDKIKEIVKYIEWDIFLKKEDVEQLKEIKNKMKNYNFIEQYKTLFGEEDLPNRLNMFRENIEKVDKLRDGLIEDKTAINSYSTGIRNIVLPQSCLSGPINYIGSIIKDDKLVKYARDMSKIEKQVNSIDRTYMKIANIGFYNISKKTPMFHQYRINNYMMRIEFLVNKYVELLDKSIERCEMISSNILANERKYKKLSLIHI